MTVSTRSVACRSGCELAAEPEADHLRNEHRDRLAEHRGFGFDPADAPAENAEAVDHRGVAVGADERIRIGVPVLVVEDATREELQIDLVANPGARRNYLEVLERFFAPAEEGVAFLIAFVFERDVILKRGRGAELIDLNGVVDDKLDRHERVDLGGVAVEHLHGVAHRGEVHDARNAGKVLRLGRGPA